MKNSKIVVLGLIMLVSSAFSGVLYGAEPSGEVADHLKMAASYEEKATAQDIVIGEHTKMKQDYKNQFFTNQKVSPTGKIQEMEKHCNAIIQDAQKLKVEYLEFAKWHRMRAAELQGR